MRLRRNMQNMENYAKRLVLISMRERSKFLGPHLPQRKILLTAWLHAPQRRITFLTRTYYLVSRLASNLATRPTSSLHRLAYYPVHKAYVTPLPKLFYRKFSVNMFMFVINLHISYVSLIFLCLFDSLCMCVSIICRVKFLFYLSMIN